MDSQKYLVNAARALLTICVLWFVALPANAAVERHALVIGNSDYDGRFKLLNPRADSTAIASSLASLGYQLHGGRAHQDLELDEFHQTIDSFLSSIKDGSSTVIYYAGHGAAAAGSNYLIPILPSGVKLRSESDIRDRSISLESVVSRLDAKNPTGVNVLFFDACREVPVEGFSRSINMAGLTELDTSRQPRGSFIGFATDYGDVALDGHDDDNSPFATALLRGFEVASAAPIELFYKNIISDVYGATSGQQFPIAESKLRGNHCIIECRGVTLEDESGEFGRIEISTVPLNAEVCYLTEGWSEYNCGLDTKLPLNKDIEVLVTAKGYKDHRTTRRLLRPNEQIRIELEKQKSNVLKIVGGVAAAILVGGLLLSGGDSGGDSGGESGGEEVGDIDEFTLILNGP